MSCKVVVDDVVVVILFLSFLILSSVNKLLLSIIDTGSGYTSLDPTLYIYLLRPARKTYKSPRYREREGYPIIHRPSQSVCVTQYLYKTVCVIG